MKLLVAITSYRVKELTLDCLRSLESEVKDNPVTRVGICDNGNEDGTADFVNHAIEENGWQNWAYVKSVRPNRGFSGGTNVILNDALNSGEDYDYYLLLNADTIVRPGAIALLLEAADRHPDAGLIGPRMESIDGEQMQSLHDYVYPISELVRAAKTGFITKLLQKPKLLPQVAESSVVPGWISFDCALIRKELMQEIGVLDERYFLYFDDIDYCRSAQNAGWKIYHEPNGVVVHYEGQSSPVVENTRMMKRRPGYWYESRSWYFNKFHGKSGLLLANLFWYVGRIVSLNRELLGNKRPHVCAAEWIDIWKGFLSSK